MAFGKDLPTQYADPTAVLTGTWGPDQEAEARVRVEKPLSGCCREVELRLRTTVAPHSITGYEIMCSVASTDPYLTIARWNGPLNDFTYIGKAKIGCADGDVLKATVLGDTITAYRNSVEVLETKDEANFLVEEAQASAFGTPPITFGGRWDFLAGKPSGFRLGCRQHEALRATICASGRSRSGATRCRGSSSASTASCSAKP